MQKHKLLECAKILRKTSTIAEQVLWPCLRNRKFMGIKFRRQYNLPKVLENIAKISNDDDDYALYQR